MDTHEARQKRVYVFYFYPWISWMYHSVLMELSGDEKNKRWKLPSLLLDEDAEVAPELCSYVYQKYGLRLARVEPIPEIGKIPTPQDGAGTYAEYYTVCFKHTFFSLTKIVFNSRLHWFTREQLIAKAPEMADILNKIPE